MGSNGRTVVFSLLLCFFISALAKIEKFEVSGDDRDNFFVKSFGFTSAGSFRISWTDTKYVEATEKTNQTTKMGILVTLQHSPSSVQLVPLLDDDTCFLNDWGMHDIAVPFFVSEPNDPNATTSKLKVIPDGEKLFQVKDEGLYLFWFVKCGDISKYDTQVTIEMYNFDPTILPDKRNYLSVGEQSLSSLYGFFVVNFTVLLGLWIYVVFNSKRHDVRAIHWLLILVVLLKVLSLFFETLRYDSIKQHGVSTSLTVVSYFFTTIKAALLMSVILLVGMGFSIVRNALTPRLKWLLGVMVALLILVNVMLAVISESTQAGKHYHQWVDLCHILDWVCCLLVFVPMFLTINNLKQNQQLDGAGRHSLHILVNFRSIYTNVIFFLGFTRITTVLVRALLSYHYAWLEYFLIETAAFIFYIIMGIRFRPTQTSGYFMLSQDENDQSVPMNTRNLGGGDSDDEL